MNMNMIESNLIFLEFEDAHRADVHQYPLSQWSIEFKRHAYWRKMRDFLPKLKEFPYITAHIEINSYLSANRREKHWKLRKFICTTPALSK